MASKVDLARRGILGLLNTLEEAPTKNLPIAKPSPLNAAPLSVGPDIPQPDNLPTDAILNAVADKVSNYSPTRRAFLQHAGSAALPLPKLPLSELTEVAAKAPKAPHALAGLYKFFRNFDEDWGIENSSLGAEDSFYNLSELLHDIQYGAVDRYTAHGKVNLERLSKKLSTLTPEEDEMVRYGGPDALEEMGWFDTQEEIDEMRKIADSLNSKMTQQEQDSVQELVNLSMDHYGGARKHSPSSPDVPVYPEEVFPNETFKKPGEASDDFGRSRIGEGITRYDRMYGNDEASAIARRELEDRAWKKQYLDWGFDPKEVEKGSRLQTSGRKLKRYKDYMVGPDSFQMGKVFPPRQNQLNPHWTVHMDNMDAPQDRPMIIHVPDIGNASIRKGLHKEALKENPEKYSQYDPIDQFENIDRGPVNTDMSYIETDEQLMPTSSIDDFIKQEAGLINDSASNLRFNLEEGGKAVPQKAYSEVENEMRKAGLTKDTVKDLKDDVDLELRKLLGPLVKQ